MVKKESGSGVIQKLLVLYLIIWTISPPLEIDMIYRLLALGCVGIWALIAVRRGLYVDKTHIYAIIFTVAVITIAYLEKGSLDGILQQIGLYILVICFVINCFYENRWEELSGIVPIVLILLTYFNWKTGNVLLEDPTIARKLVRADESVYVYLRQGVGGYSLIYPQVCIFPAILAWIMKAFRRDNKCFILGCVWLVSYIRVINNAGYSLAIFATIAGAIIMLINKSKSSVKPIIITIIIFLSVFGAIIYIDSFREFLLTQFDGTAVAKKIEDLMLSAEEGSAEGSIEDRRVAYIGSLEVIAQYPIIGSLWMKSGGGHSALLDTFAKYGIWGGFIYAKMLFHVPGYYKSKIGHPTIYSISNGVIVSILFVSMLDSFTYSFMCMILLVLPLLYEDIIKWERLD